MDKAFRDDMAAGYTLDEPAIVLGSPLLGAEVLPEVRVQVSLPKGPQELLIGKKAGPTEYYARSGSQDAVFTVPDFTVTDLKVTPDQITMGKK